MAQHGHDQLAVARPAVHHQDGRHRRSATHRGDARAIRAAHAELGQDQGLTRLDGKPDISTDGTPISNPLNS
jgi:hypothetical protein